MKIRLIDNYET